MRVFVNVAFSKKTIWKGVGEILMSVTRDIQY